MNYNLFGLFLLFGTCHGLLVNYTKQMNDTKFYSSGYIDPNDIYTVIAECGQEFNLESQKCVSDSLDKWFPNGMNNPEDIDVHKTCCYGLDTIYCLEKKLPDCK